MFWYFVICTLYFLVGFVREFNKGFLYNKPNDTSGKWINLDYPIKFVMFVLSFYLSITYC